MLTAIQQPIDALVIYRRGAPHPLLRAFRWNNRRFEVTSIHLVHREREGETAYLVYSIDCGGDTYLVRLDVERGQWTLEACEMVG